MLKKERLVRITQMVNQKGIISINEIMEQAKLAATHNATQFEKDLIDALAPRFPKHVTIDEQDFHELNFAYAQAMRSFYEKYSNDLDAAAMFADALMCLSPRKLWDLDTGEAIGLGTVEARNVLEVAFTKPGANRHPVINHLYIHLMEMSPYPEVALPAADNLRNLSPDGSHLAHMSTHIDNACGDWRRVVYSNLDAIAADERYFSREKNPGGWNILYRVHNLMVGAYGAMMAGKSQEALFMAHVLPTRPADLLNETEVVSLHRAIRKVLRDGLANGGTSFRDYRNGEGKRGHNQDHLKVYGRGGKPCVRCGRPLADMTLRGRHTVFCEKCQK